MNVPTAIRLTGVLIFLLVVSCLYRFTIRRLAPLYTRQQDGEFCSNKGDQTNSVKYQESKCGETSVTDVFKPTDREKIVAMQFNDG